MFDKKGMDEEHKILMNGEKLEQRKKYVCLNRLFANDGSFHRGTERKAIARNQMNKTVHGQ